MINAEFRRSGGRLCGFSVSGHSGYASAGSDIVCASVSSAVMLACNLATDIFKLDADVSVGANEISLSLKSGDSGVIEGLYQHLKALGEEYPENISVKISEV